MTQDTYRRTAAGQHPANLSPEYKSTPSRAPRQAPVVLPQSLSEITGPLLTSERVGEARLNVVRAFERMGLELFVEPTDGMFVWARLPQVEDSLPLAEASQRDGIMLAPGAVFRPHLERSPWLRFNVTVCEDTRVQRWLERQAAGKAA